MEKPADGDAALTSSPLGILGTAVTSSGVTYDLNGTVLEVVGSPMNYPAQCNPENPDWCWPTELMAMNRTVLMITGETWRLNRPPNRLQDGRVQVSIKAMTGSRSAVFNVPADALSTPLWNVGEPYVPPAPPEEPVVNPDFPTNPIPPEGPQQPPESPLEP